MQRIICCALILVLAGLWLPAERPAQAATTYTVTNTLDSGAGSLRYAINSANGNAGADTIAFAIPMTDPGCVPATGVCTIHVNNILLVAADNAGVTIDGYTQPGAAYAAGTSPALIKIVLDGIGLDTGQTYNVAVLGLNSGHNVVRGLSIINSPTNGIVVSKVGTTGTPNFNSISGNYIGTDPGGTADRGNAWDGVFLGEGSYSTVVGGLTPASRNIISGNDIEGVGIWGTMTVSNYVVGNYIGVDASGNTALPNVTNGVRIYGGANQNIVGWETPAGRNIISGNGYSNVRFAGAGTNQNGLANNYIGTNAAGDAALGGQIGVYILDGAAQSFIGGSISATGNLISGNSNYGVMVEGDATLLTYIYGNWIGLNAAGTTALPNGTQGVLISNSLGVQIGGPTAIMRNVISGNAHNGIEIHGTSATSNQVRNNYIGTNPAGDAAIPNGWNGVLLSDGAHDNIIGGDNIGQGNLISGNTSSGVSIYGSGTANNSVSGNLIGPNAAGDQALSSQEKGVWIHYGAQSNIIGGDDLVSDGVTPGTFSRNVISGNTSMQVYIEGSGTNLNRVTGNYIGSDISGMNALTGTLDGSSGVYIQNGASENIIGRCDETEGNLISGNNGHGLAIGEAGVNNNAAACNLIGVAADMVSPLGNNGHGVSMTGISSNNYIGPSNTIAYNQMDGVLVVGADADNNQITRNSIYSNAGIGIYLLFGGNNDTPAPVISGATLGSAPGDDDTVSGTACASCRVEVFASPTDDGEGMAYVGSVTAGGDGSFTLTAVTLPYACLTATAYRTGDGTSMFSAVYTAPFYFYYLPAIQ